MRPSTTEYTAKAHPESQQLSTEAAAVVDAIQALNATLRKISHILDGTSLNAQRTQPR